MEKILQSLHELEGVNGTLITDPSGNILACNAHSMYDTSVLQQVSRSVVAALDSVRLVHEEWETVTAQFSEGRLLLRNLASGARQGGTVALREVAVMARFVARLSQLVAHTSGSPPL